MKSMASGERLPSAGSPELVLQKILDSTRECVLVVSQNLRITNYNVHAAVSFGREGLDLEGRRLSEVLRNIELHGAFQRALTEQVSSDIQFELIRTGTRKFDVHIAPIELNGQHFGRVSGNRN